MTGSGHGLGGEAGDVPMAASPGNSTFCLGRASCWQPGTRTPAPPGVSEDCLYLNVFVPENVVSLEALAVVFLAECPFGLADVAPVSPRRSCTSMLGIACVLATLSPATASWDLMSVSKQEGALTLPMPHLTLLHPHHCNMLGWSHYPHCIGQR